MQNTHLRTQGAFCIRMVISESTAVTVFVGAITTGTWSLGVCCHIVGLKSAQQHNGAESVLLEHQGERVRVMTQGAGELRVKHDNLAARSEYSTFLGKNFRLTGKYVCMQTCMHVCMYVC